MAATWEELNQQHLTQALGCVRAALQHYIARARGELPDGGPLPDPPAALAPPAALETLCATFKLSPFERELLLLCAGSDLDGSFSALCAAAQGDPQRAYPTFGLALAALPGAHWSAITPAAPLRRWRLIDVAGGVALTQCPLRISERVLHYLAGVSYQDEQLAGLMRPIVARGDLLPSQRALAAQVASAWSRAPVGALLPVVLLSGADRAAKHAIATAACASLGLHAYVLAADALPTSLHEVEGLMRLWGREAALNGSALIIDCDTLEEADARHAAAMSRLIEHLSGAIVVTCRERRPALERQMFVFDVSKPPAAEQRAAWRTTLGPEAERLNGRIDTLVAQFNLGAHTIRSACAEALGRVSQAPEAELGHVLWEACRAQARPRLDDLAQRIEPAAAWDDLVLPEAQLRLLRQLQAHVRQRARVYEVWGFAATGARGLGISALFAGESGTGKTMAAEVIANELHLDLYKIDLSAVVSKYIGETERNLRRIFDAAEEGGAVLLFDEADALFGKRSEVRDSHDRYANIETSYLLQRMEEYRGLAILTTNMKSALDSAFLRRIRFVVQFPFPDAAQRAAIWRGIFPPATPTESLDLEKLAGLNIAGGNICNIALGAAFLAADEGAPVRMVHLLDAARAEYTKLEKTLTGAETAGWETNGK